jgi:hypothetical protein
MAGQNIMLSHNLNTADIAVEILGKTAVNGGTHQKYLGLTSYTSGWNKVYRGEAFENYWNSVIQSSDGGYAITGYTRFSSESSWVVQLVKTDSVGNIQWNKTYGGDTGWSLIQAIDGGYAIAGISGGKVLLLKTDPIGNAQWNKTFEGGPESYGWSLIQTKDGGYAIAGQASDNVYLVKTDASGNMQWGNSYGGSDEDYGSSVVQTTDGGYAIVGTTYSFGARGSTGFFTDIYFVKTDAAGNMQWNKTYGGPQGEYGNAVAQTSDGGYVILGSTSSFGAGDWDFYLFRIDPVGNVVWNKTFGGNREDDGLSMVETDSGGYMLAGYTWSFGVMYPDVYLVQVDSAGNVIWSKMYDEGGIVFKTSMCKTIDGGVAIIGEYPGGHFLIKTDVELGLAWTNSTADTLTLHRGETDCYWNYVRVRIWKTD